MTWSTIVPANVPIPSAGGTVLIYAAHVQALRDALDTARSLIPNLPAISYSNPVAGSIISAANVNQLIGGLQ